MKRRRIPVLALAMAVCLLLGGAVLAPDQASTSSPPRSNPRFGETAQWQPWSAMASNGHLWVAFYDRSYGACETSGCTDITAAEITNPAGPTPTIDYSRVTTESMPNLTTANNPLEAGFLGDRLGLDIDSLNRADIAWADTRPSAGAEPEEDVYYARVPALPPPPPPPPPRKGQGVNLVLGRR